MSNNKNHCIYRWIVVLAANFIYYAIIYTIINNLVLNWKYRPTSPPLYTQAKDDAV